MNFETEYKKIIFHIALEKADVADITLLFGTKLAPLSRSIIIKLKKDELAPYHLIIKSKKNSVERTHYWNHILLKHKTDDLQSELMEFLVEGNILDLIVANWKLIDNNSGPAWKKAAPTKK